MIKIRVMRPAYPCKERHWISFVRRTGTGGDGKELAQAGRRKIFGKENG